MLVCSCFRLVCEVCMLVYSCVWLVGVRFGLSSRCCRLWVKVCGVFELCGLLGWFLLSLVF